MGLFAKLATNKHLYASRIINFIFQIFFRGKEQFFFVDYTVKREFWGLIQYIKFNLQSHQFHYNYKGHSRTCRVQPTLKYIKYMFVFLIVVLFVLILTCVLLFIVVQLKFRKMSRPQMTILPYKFGYSLFFPLHKKVKDFSKAITSRIIWNIKKCI